MKLLCRKCQYPLTRRSLYPAKDWIQYTRILETISNGNEDDDFIYERIQHAVPVGSFLIEKESYWLSPGEKFNFIINPVDVIENLVPPFKRGGGCCDWYGAQLNCPSCGKEVGEANLDCHQSKHVMFPESKVIRSYK